MKPERNLKIYSILFIVLAFIDIALLAFQTFDGYLADQVAATGVSTDIQNLAIIITWVIVAIVALIKLYVGIRGLCYSVGKTKKAGFITFMKVVLGLEIAGIVISCFAKNGISGTNVLTYAINVIIIVYFIKYAEDVKKNKK